MQKIDACTHPFTRVASTRTIREEGREFTKQTLACIDCDQICDWKSII